MPRWTFFDQQTGVIARRRLTAPTIEAAQRNAPLGHGVIAGDYIADTHHVDLSGDAPTVVAKVDPPYPPNPDLEWSPVFRRWLVSARAAKRKDAQAKIEAIERSQARPIRELAIDPGNDSARKTLERLDAEIAALRHLL